MKEGNYCQTIDESCNPKDCPVEFCGWRDSVWAIAMLKKIANSAPIKPEEKQKPLPK